MGKTAVITDVHGRLPELRAILAQIPDDTQIVVLGDMVDRGTDSRGVVELVRSIPGAICLRGNHEDMLCAPDPRMWLANGGASTVLSYKHPLTGALDPVALQRDMDWFRSLRCIHSDAHRVYVHAGLLPLADLADQPESITQWFRYPDGYDTGWRGKHIVHGHTPGVLTLTNRTCLDAGMGSLCCGLFDDDLPGGPVELLWA
jgi:serine/threonine protein phosphatase 1